MNNSVIICVKGVPGIIQKEFKSKKNNVFLIKTPDEKRPYVVYKNYARPESMIREVDLLNILKGKGVAVPQIYSTGKDYIYLEYLEGPLLLDSVSWQEEISGSASISLPESTHQLILRLCRWFKQFYQALRQPDGAQLIMGDVNFRNFIVGEIIYGIDFEECREGTIEEEVGSFCAYALTYTPSFTPWKLALIKQLIKVFTYELNMDNELVTKEIKKQLLFLAEIRGTVHEIGGILESNLLEKTIYSK